jgi:uncharacterized protein YjbI with pentapeptide repeats
MKGANLGDANLRDADLRNCPKSLELAGGVAL